MALSRSIGHFALNSEYTPLLFLNIQSLSSGSRRVIDAILLALAVSFSQGFALGKIASLFSRTAKKMNEISFAIS